MFTETQILAATGRLIATNGPDGATIGAIARAVGAPTGSIYHRFASRDVLLGEVWLQAAAAFQAAFFERLAASPPQHAGLAAALYMAQRVREHPREARLLLLHRREDFIDRGWPPTLRRRAQQLGRQVEAEIRAFSRRLCGRDDARTVRIVTYAVLEAPLAAVRRHVAANESPPPHVDVLIRVTFEAVIGLLPPRGVKETHAPEVAEMQGEWSAVGPIRPLESDHGKRYSARLTDESQHLPSAMPARRTPRNGRSMG